MEREVEVEGVAASLPTTGTRAASLMVPEESCVCQSAASNIQGFSLELSILNSL